MVEHMRIGELAQRAGVTPRTIRYYESLGLLDTPEREGSGFRYYDETTLARLKKIEFLKRINFSLDEIVSVIPLYFSEPTSLQGKQKMLAIMEQHLQEADGKIEALQRFREELVRGIASLRPMVEKTSQE